MTLHTPIFPTVEARETAIRRIQRFLNTRQDMFSLPQKLYENGQLDAATCDALTRAADFSKSWGNDAIPGGGDDASLAVLDERLRKQGYSYDLGRLLARAPQPNAVEESKRWWRSVQSLLEEKGMHFDAHYARRTQIAEKLSAYIATHEDGRLIGWLGSEGQGLPAPILHYLEPVLAAMPGRRSAGALLASHTHTTPEPVLSFAPTMVTYSFAVPDASMRESIYHQSAKPMSPAAQKMLRDCMDEIEQVCGVKFIELKAPLKAHLYAYTDEARAKSAVPNWSGMVPARPVGQAVPVIFNEAVGETLANQDDVRRVMLHELEHALNLKHPHTPIDDFTRRMAKPIDNINHTVMSYFYLPHQPLADNPMGLDIDMLQQQFGPPRIFTQSSRGYRIAENANAPVRRTLMDQDAALDWIDASNQKESVQIDLRPGLPQHSRIGQHRLWIAPGSRIEGAVGGIGNDVLIAGPGQSYLFGGEGRDRFEIHDAGHHRILDMKAEDALVIGAGLRKAGAVYTETPWGVTVRMAQVLSKPGAPTTAPVQLDIATDDSAAVIAKLKALLPQLKEQGVLKLLPTTDPRLGLSLPDEAVELNGNQNPSHVRASQAWPKESLLLKKPQTALPWR